MANFSCYINIKNESELDLINGEYGQSYGKYDSKPATTLDSGNNTKFRLKDKSGPAGSTGYVKYKTSSGGELRFDYDCPYGSGSNVLKCSKNSSGLEVFSYGENSDKYIEEIPLNTNGVYPKKGHPLSGIFVLRDPLSAGWDIITAIKIDVLNDEIKSLYDKQIIPHSLDGISIECPEVYATDDGLNVKVVLDGKKLINVSGEYSFNINLDDIQVSIEKSDDSYNLLVSFTQDLISDIDTPKPIISKVLKNILKNISSPIKIPLNLKVAVSLDNVVIDLKLVKNTEDLNKSFFAIMIGFNGKEGSRNLSSDIIYDLDSCNISFVVSNQFIMEQLKGAIDKVLAMPSNELVLTNDYPSALYNEKDIKIDSIDKVHLKIKEDDFNIHINKDGDLFVKLVVKWSNKATLGADGSTEVDLTFSFSAEDGDIAVKVSKKVDTSAPWWLFLIGGIIDNIINKHFIEPILNSLGDSVISIPNFEVLNIISPSYIRVSGKVAAKTK